MASGRGRQDTFIYPHWNMDQTLQKTLHILLLSLGLAVVFNYLFFGKALGISVFVCNAVLLGAVFGFARYQKLDFGKSYRLAAPILFFALMPAVRASEVLTFFNVVATFGLLMLLAYQLTGIPVVLMQLRDYTTLAMLVPFRMLGRALHTVSVLGHIQSTVKSRDVWVRVLKGVLMALPILIIFGALFSQADLAFSQFLSNFISIRISEHTAQYLALLTFAFVAALCYLSYIFFVPTTPNPRGPSSGVEDGTLGAHPSKQIEILVFLSLVASLFLLFIGFQVTYLFGGETNIASTGFTYAEYARRGFGELLGIAALSLILLFAADQYAGSATKRNNYFLVPALILIAEVGIVIISALKRLSLYIDAYGLTEPRLYAGAFILLLLALFILLAITFVRSKPEHFFMFGTLLSTLAFLALLNVLSPDAYIAQYNVSRYIRTGKVDVDNIGYLSTDAAAAKLELHTRLEGEAQQVLDSYLAKQAGRLELDTAHWQSFNLSRFRGSAVLEPFK